MLEIDFWEVFGYFWLIGGDSVLFGVLVEFLCKFWEFCVLVEICWLGGIWLLFGSVWVLCWLFFGFILEVVIGDVFGGCKIGVMDGFLLGGIWFIDGVCDWCLGGVFCEDWWDIWIGREGVELLCFCEGFSCWEDNRGVVFDEVGCIVVGEVKVGDIMGVKFVGGKLGFVLIVWVVGIDDIVGFELGKECLDFSCSEIELWNGVVDCDIVGWGVGIIGRVGLGFGEFDDGIFIGESGCWEDEGLEGEIIGGVGIGWLLGWDNGWCGCCCCGVVFGKKFRIWEFEG